MHVNPRLFAGEEEQAELSVADDGGGHGGTLSEQFPVQPAMSRGQLEPVAV